LEIKAKLRQRHDRDIEKAIKEMNLEKGELSDLVRDGFRLIIKAMEKGDRYEATKRS